MISPTVTNTATTAAVSQHVISTLSQQGEQTPTEAQQMLQIFWQKQLDGVQNMDVNDFKVQELPLARIKKIMKMDEDVKMISAEAPLLFAKAAQMFITELSLRAWIHTEENKRRTLQRNDIATAITKFDQFDFLIDIVPREELKPARRPTEETRPNNDTVYFYSVPQQQGQQQTQATVVSQNTTQNSSTASQSSQIVLAPSGQIVQLSPSGQIVGGDANQQVVQLAQTQQQGQQQGNTIVIGGNQQPTNIVLNTQETQQTHTISQNILQQLIANSGTSTGEVHSIQINADGQVQLVKVPASSSDTQDQGNRPNESILL